MPLCPDPNLHLLPSTHKTTVSPREEAFLRDKAIANFSALLLQSFLLGYLHADATRGVCYCLPPYGCFKWQFEAPLAL